jgi:type IV pilus assembly protein PilA
MLQKLKQRLKNQRGMTLVELLAVIVILGIISAIAVPSIGGLIDNTKKDAHVANAQQMVNAARMAITSDVNLQKTGTLYLPLLYLENQNFLEAVSDPDGGSSSYAKGNDQIEDSSFVEINATSFVKITDGKVVAVKLVNGTRGVQTSGKTGVAPADLKRGVVIKN